MWIWIFIVWFVVWSCVHDFHFFSIFVLQWSRVTNFVSGMFLILILDIISFLCIYQWYIRKKNPVLLTTVSHCGLRQWKFTHISIQFEVKNYNIYVYWHNTDINLSPVQFLPFSHRIALEIVWNIPIKIKIGWYVASVCIIYYTYTQDMQLTDYMSTSSEVTHYILYKKSIYFEGVQCGQINVTCLYKRPCT